MTLQTHRLTRCGFILVASALAISLEVTGCGTSPKATPGTQPSPPGATDSRVIVPASAETIAALGVTSWGITNRTPNSSVLIAGIDDTAHVMRELFSADVEKDASGEVNVSLTSIFSGPVSITLQSKDGQSVLQSNEFPNDANAAQALELLSADLQHNGGPSAGTTAPAGMHPLDLIVDAGPLLCSGGKLCAEAMTNIANQYQSHPNTPVDVFALSKGCSPDACAASVVNTCLDACWYQSRSRPGGADPCLHVQCNPNDESRSKNTDPNGWACVYNCGGGDYSTQKQQWEYDHCWVQHNKGGNRTFCNADPPS
jgi:hypothetical protein